jgi:hypothetical protein
MLRLYHDLKPDESTRHPHNVILGFSHFWRVTTTAYFKLRSWVSKLRPSSAVLKERNVSEFRCFPFRWKCGTYTYTVGPLGECNCNHWPILDLNLHLYEFRLPCRMGPVVLVSNLIGASIKIEICCNFLLSLWRKKYKIVVGVMCAVCTAISGP